MEEQRDPDSDLMAALHERQAGLPARQMLERADALAKANAYLREQGRPDVAVSAIPNPLQGLWVVDYRDPAHPGQIIAGDGLLIVPTSGGVYETGSVPDWPEMVGAELPESDRDDWLPADWAQQLGAEFEKDYWVDLLEFVAQERMAGDVYPPPSQTFAAFEKTPFDQVKVVILGQDPYHGPGQAQGLAFSVPRGVRKPPSVAKIHKALERDLGIEAPRHGNLEGWAEQGVLLLNTTLTVRRGAAGSHHGRNWERFTDEVIKVVSGRRSGPVVFMLWGGPAIKKRKLIDESVHKVISAAHPQARVNAKDPLFASRAFSRADTFLAEADRIDWGRFAAIA